LLGRLRNSIKRRVNLSTPSLRLIKMTVVVSGQCTSEGIGTSVLSRAGNTQSKPSRTGSSLSNVMADVPKCPFCGAPYFQCKTDFRGICIKKPK
jgi:hypothetical protein